MSLYVGTGRSGLHWLSGCLRIIERGGAGAASETCCIRLYTGGQVLAVIDRGGGRIMIALYA